MKVIFLFLLSASAHAETWKVRGAGAEFFLDYQVSYLSYSGRVVRAKVGLTDCNRGLAKALMQTLKKDLANPMSYASEKGIKVVIDGQRASDVKVDSAFGLTLLTMDDRFQRFNLAQEAACSSSL